MNLTQALARFAYGFGLLLSGLALTMIITLEMSGVSSASTAITGLLAAIGTLICSLGLLSTYERRGRDG